MKDSCEITADDGIRLFVRTQGAGERVLIVPNAIYMERDFDWLADGRKVAFYDLRNRGRSERVADPVKLKRGAHQDVDDLETVRRHLGVECVDVLGHSYLGVVVALYAMKYGEHVNRVVQVSPGQPDMAKQYPPNLSNTDAVLSEVFTALAQLQARRKDTDPIAYCEEAWSFLRRMYIVDAADVGKIGHWGFCEFENERSMLAHFNGNILPTLRALALTADDYVKVTAPVLVIHGVKDRNAPYGGGRDWAISLPNARLLKIDAAAHAPWVEAPRLVCESIKTFLDGAWPAAAEKIILGSNGDQFT